MRKTLLFVVFCLGVSIINAASYREVVESYKQSLKTDVSIARITDLNDIYNKVQVLKDQAVPLTQVLAADNVCKFLSGLEIDPVAHAHLLDQYISLRKDFQCTNIEIVKKFDNYFKRISKSDKFNDVRTAIVIGSKEQVFDTEKIKELCAKLPDFLASNGSTKATKKAQSGSLRDTAALLETLYICQTNKVDSSKAADQIRKPLENLLSSAKYTSEDTLAFVEDDFLITTSNLIYWIVKTNILTIPADKLGHFAKYFHLNRDALVTSERTAAYFRVAGALKNVPVVSLANPTLPTGKAADLEARIINLLDDNIDPTTAKVTISPRGQKPVIDSVKLAKGNAGVWRASIDGAKLGKPGYYDAIFEIKSNNQTYHYQNTILVQGVITLDKVQFDIKNRATTEERLTHEIKFNKKHSDLLTANQNNFIHVQFKISSEAPRINYAAVRLIHPKYKYTTNAVPAKQEKDSNEFKAVVDLGDPDQILPYNAVYEVELIVASEYAKENLIWNFASVNITFIKPKTDAPATEADTQLLPLITHQFPPERRKPSVLITGAFVGIALAILLGYFLALGKLNVNFGKFPGDFFGSVMSILFLVAILALIGVLVLFWTKINLFETLTVLLIAVIPAVVIGNIALRQRKNNN